MDTEKHGDIAVLIYLFLLLIFAGCNLITGGNILDLVYLVIILCGILKYLSCI